MRTNNCGHIIATGSVLSRISVPGRAAYAAAKHGLCSYLEVLGLELAATGSAVRVTHAMVGYCRTDIARRALRADGSSVQGQDPQTDGGLQPDRVAALMLRAASNDCRETWISRQPYLAFLYASHYMPDMAKCLLRWRSPSLIKADKKLIAPPLQGSKSTVERE
eukprot:GHVU01213115.1.p2 GENE.GHVU01213115.1~~GHVU01213115.1.p2  ORF type:complete len:164 (+),score=31.25 GHVU01213115.1:931-1422(+)